MIKKLAGIGSISLVLLSLFGCSAVGDKSLSLSTIYLATTILALILLGAYCLLIRKRQLWLTILFLAVSIVNTGYFALSISSTLEEALLSNRIAYAGSVILPLSMLMVILHTCQIKFPKWATYTLTGISAVVFLIAASPGYLDVYYKEVTLTTVGGATALEKVYGPLHSVYLYYLLGHFLLMAGAIAYSFVKKKISSPSQAVLLLSSVLVNMGVWLMEQLIKVEFEFLAVSYILSEVFLLCFYVLIQDMLQKAPVTQQSTSAPPSSVPSQSNDEEDKEKVQHLASMLHTLTPTEKQVYTLYLEGKGTKEVMQELTITENTLKYHNRNIYSKLGVSSRKELLKIATLATKEINSK